MNAPEIVQDQFADDDMDIPILQPRTGKALRIDMGEFKRITSSAEKWDRMLALLTVCRDRLDPDEDAELVKEIGEMLR